MHNTSIDQVAYQATLGLLAATHDGCSCSRALVFESRLYQRNVTALHQQKSMRSRCASQGMAVLAVMLFVCAAHGKLPAGLGERLDVNFSTAAIRIQGLATHSMRHGVVMLNVTTVLRAIRA